jgi:DNA-binding NarL/FixJ family response regulator
MKPQTSRPAIERSVKPPLRVALVEDQPEIRKSWQRLIESFRDFKFVCACSSAEEALQAVPPARPDVVLMDIFLPRIEEVLELLSKGYANKEIADRLELSIDTVRSHLKHIYEKMHLRSRTEAVARHVAGKPSTPEAGGLQPG